MLAGIVVSAIAAEAMGVKAVVRVLVIVAVIDRRDGCRSGGGGGD